jgi:hypothetical protein
MKQKTLLHRREAKGAATDPRREFIDSARFRKRDSPPDSTFEENLTNGVAGVSHDD